MKKGIIATIIITILIIVGGYFLFGRQKTEQAVLRESPDLRQAQESLKEKEVSRESGGGEPKEEIQNETGAEKKIIYDTNGFSPRALTIKAGGTVVWRNQSSSKMWVASGLHPSHKAYDGTSLQQHCPDTDNMALDQCAGGQQGESWSFKFDKKGIWEYHNHLKPSDTGKITVE